MTPKKKKRICSLSQSLICLFGIVNLLSCNPIDDASAINLAQKDQISVFEIFSEVEVVKLETSESNLISQIGKVEYYDSHYYILDQFSQQIFCFDEQGRFVFKIDSKGNGPGEYNHVADFSIDKRNRQLVLLDPAFQRVHFFCLKGNYLSSHGINTDKVLGLRRAYSLQDSVLLLISLTNERLQFYSMKQEKVLYAYFNYKVPSTLHSFDNFIDVSFLGDKILFLAPLSREIVDVSSLYPEPHFTWCFGSNNNSDQQINRLIELINVKQEIPEYINYPFQAVGKGKILHHHIMKSFENERFRIATVEFDNGFKFVVMDKAEGKTIVFDSFSEGFLVPFEFMQSDRAIIFYIPEFDASDIEKIQDVEVQEYFLTRNLKLYSPEILKEDCRKIIETHNPMTDNPFLVVYKFKE